MKIFRITLLSLISILFIGCEKEWYYNNGQDNKISLFLTAYADSIIIGTGWPVVDVLNPNINSNIDDADGTIVSQSTGYFSINSGGPIQFEKIYERNNPLWGNFMYNYPFKGGDTINVNVKCNNYIPVVSSTIMPDKPSIYAECIGYEVDPEVTGTSDSLMIIKVGIKDNKAKNNYYILHAGSHREAIFSIKFNKLPEYLLQYITQGRDTMYESKMCYNYFHSDESLFSNSKVTVLNEKSCLSEPLFDDNLLDAKGEFIIKCRKCPSKLPEITDSLQIMHIKERLLTNQKHYVLIRLDELSEEYYKYLKYTENPDMYNLPPSNVEGGYGVFGAVNRSATIRLNF